MLVVSLNFDNFYSEMSNDYLPYFVSMIVPPCIQKQKPKPTPDTSPIMYTACRLLAQMGISVGFLKAINSMSAFILIQSCGTM